MHTSSLRHIVRPQLRSRASRQLAATLAFITATAIGALASADQVNDLYVMQDSRLFRVSTADGDNYEQRGDADWAGATSMASFSSGSLYVIQDGRLWTVNPNDGSYTPFPGAAGAAGAWTGTTRMTAASTNDVPSQQALFITQAGSLWRVKLDGSYVSLGGGWTGTTSLSSATVGTTKWLFAIQDSKLWRVNPGTGSTLALESGWAGSTRMTSSGTLLYIIQDNTLWKFDPSSNTTTSLTDDTWSGATSMVHFPGPYPKGGVFVIQNNRLYQVNLTDNSIHTRSSGIWTGPTLMARKYAIIH